MKNQTVMKKPIDREEDEGIDQIWSFTLIDPFGVRHTYQVTAGGTEEEMIEFMGMVTHIAGFPWLIVGLKMEPPDTFKSINKGKGGVYESKPKNKESTEADDDRPERRS